MGRGGVVMRTVLIGKRLARSVIVVITASVIAFGLVVLAELAGISLLARAE